MKKHYLKFTISALTIATLLLFQACSKSSDKATGSGDAEFQITDAPSDDANIQGVFVTIADIKVDGQSVSGFSKQTIDLKAYQEGNAKLLATSHLSAKSYSNLVLVLDTDTDANGQAPGTYVLTTGGSKYRLKSSGTQTITVNNTWSVAANTKSTVIIDFDLRKSIRSVSDPAIRYSFVSNDNLQSSIRIVNQNKSGTINGTYTEQVSPNADKVFVYAYKKGTYNSGVETTAQGDDAIMFKNAVASAEVRGALTAKSYKLAFLESGDYELYFAAYDEDINNHFVFQGVLQSSTSASGSVGNIITVQSGVNVSATTTITGL